LINIEFIKKELPACCEIDSFPVSLCSQSEKQALKELLPECKSVIVLAHHVKHPLEWVWFPLEAERNQVTCAADLHLKLECEKLASILKEEGYQSSIIPYPGRCGIRFKDLANKTGLGKIGDNFMFLHRQWGTWTHLRVIAVNIEILDNLPPCGEVCNHCGICKTSCPAKAIKDDTLLGSRCDEYQDNQAAIKGLQGDYVSKCEVCARACPIGTVPERIVIAHNLIRT
jgi:epoxyqueuosine reductase